MYFIYFFFFSFFIFVSFHSIHFFLFLDLNRGCSISDALHGQQHSFPPDQRITIIDLVPLSVATKSVPPLEQQLPHESLSLWAEVTRAIHNKQYSRATLVKQELEERQREKARERERNGVTWTPVFFAQTTGNGGKPELTEKGRQVLERAQRGEWVLDDIFP